MKRFVEGLDREQSTLFPAFDDYVAEDNSVRAVDVFVDGLGRLRAGIRGPGVAFINAMNGEGSTVRPQR
jgi:hypothetical protein